MKSIPRFLTTDPLPSFVLRCVARGGVIREQRWLRTFPRLRWKPCEGEPGADLTALERAVLRQFIRDGLVDGDGLGLRAGRWMYVLTETGQEAVTYLLGEPT